MNTKINYLQRYIFILELQITNYELRITKKNVDLFICDFAFDFAQATERILSVAEVLICVIVDLYFLPQRHTKFTNSDFV